MNYHTFEPSNDLAPFVKYYWTLESPREEVVHRQTIVPDGCMEMIFHCGDLYKQFLEDGTEIIQPRSFVFGQITSPLEIAPAGETNIFSVRFHPEGFVPFATMPIKEMDNRAVSLEILFGEKGQNIARDVINATATPQRIEIVEKFLTGFLTDSATIDTIVKSTVETIVTANGQLTVEEISRLQNINRRQLERKFSSAIGLSPKQLSKMIRMQATLRELVSRPHISLAALAHENEYYDQAHFIKDFKEFTGLTPKEFYSDNLRMTSLFSSRD